MTDLTGIPYGPAVPMVQLADLIETNSMTVRMWIKRGFIPGAFRENIWPSGRARWMIPIDEARQVAAKRGYDPADVDTIIEPYVAHHPDQETP